METVIIGTGNQQAIRESVAIAVDHLEKGSIVALPTETVYGLAANALDAKACAKVFEAKERPNFDPLIVHVSGEKMLNSVADIPEEIEDTLSTLINEFWPGALTFILPKKEIVPEIVTSGLDTVAVRRSKNPIFAEIINTLELPIAAPSANRFGSISPTSANAVLCELSGKIPYIIDGGACSEGVESTIIKIESETGRKKPNIQILRPGPVTPEMLKKFGKIEKNHKSKTSSKELTSPGQLDSHYAPITPLRIINSPDTFTPEQSKTYALLSYRGQKKDGYIELCEWKLIETLSPGSGKLPEAAVRFFFALRKLDQLGVDEIISEPIPERGIGIAIMDRLKRASHQSS
mgnify:FL=1